jgi:hypothetical protein
VTDIDDLLTLPIEDDDDESADRPAPEEHAPRGIDPVVSTELVALSSSEARLATALLMQAQALEAMRREQSDLLKRIEGGPSRAALVRSLGQVEAALKQVARLQQKARGQIARTRKRSTRLTGVLLFITLGLAGAVGWMAWTMQRELPESLSNMESRLEAAEASRGADIERAVSAAVAGATSATDDALASITSRLDQEQQRLVGELAVLQGVNDATKGALDEAHTENTDLRFQLDTLGASHAEMDLQLGEVRQERNRQIGENARLVEQVMDSERRLQELSETVAGLRAAQPPITPPPVASAIIASPPVVADGAAGRLTAALRSSGVLDLAVIEVGTISDGAMHDVLLRQVDAAGNEARILQAGLAWIVIEGGLARLRLDPVREQGAEQDAVIDVPLPALQAAVWRAEGVTVPGGFVPLPQVMTALDVLLSGQGWRITKLDSFDGDALGGLELVQEDENGIVLRSIHADSGFVLPTGPELELRDGSIRIGGDERPFYRGVFLLPLPGSDYGGWLVATDGSAW